MTLFVVNQFVRKDHKLQFWILIFSDSRYNIPLRFHTQPSLSLSLSHTHTYTHTHTHAHTHTHTRTHTHTHTHTLSLSPPLLLFLCLKLSHIYPTEKKMVSTIRLNYNFFFNADLLKKELLVSQEWIWHNGFEFKLIFWMETNSNSIFSPTSQLMLLVQIPL